MSLSFDPSSVHLEVSHYIAGKVITGAGALALARPSDGQFCAECPIASPDLVDQAVDAAQTALKTSGWSICPPRDRAKAMVAWADRTRTIWGDRRDYAVEFPDVDGCLEAGTRFGCGQCGCPEALRDDTVFDRPTGPTGGASRSPHGLDKHRSG